MLCEKIIKKPLDDNKRTDIVLIEWFERDKKLLRKTTSAGDEIGIMSDEPLCSGDILYEDDEKQVVVRISPCDLISVKIKSLKCMGRLCFELGNRHLSISISDDTVKAPYDEPTFEYLKKLGFDVSKVNEEFTDFIECKAHSHVHDHHG